MTQRGLWASGKITVASQCPLTEHMPPSCPLNKKKQKISDVILHDMQYGVGIIQWEVDTLPQLHLIFKFYRLMGKKNETRFS